jgi:hypothetical protein
VWQELSFFHRDFAASRLRVNLDPAQSHEEREEAMIAELKHYPAMMFSGVLLLRGFISFFPSL